MSQCLLIGNPAREALAAKDAQLDLRHVQPAAVLRGVVKLKAAQYPPRLFGSERLVQRGGAVRVQVVHDYRDPFAPGKCSSTSSRMARAQSIFVRRSVTLTCRQPSRGAKNMNRLLLSLIHISEPTRLGMSS